MPIESKLQSQMSQMGNVDSIEFVWIHPEMSGARVSWHCWRTCCGKNRSLDALDIASITWRGIVDHSRNFLDGQSVSFRWEHFWFVQVNLFDKPTTAIADLNFTVCRFEPLRDAPIAWPWLGQNGCVPCLDMSWMFDHCARKGLNSMIHSAN